MSLIEDYIQRLRSDVIRYQEKIRSAEVGEARFSVKGPGGVWIDKTAEWLAEDRRTLAIYESLLAKFDRDGKI